MNYKRLRNSHMKLKKISRQKIKPWYYIGVTRKKQHQNANIESEDLNNDI